MNILVCFKVVSNLDQMSPTDFVVGDNMEIDTSFVKTELNCFDESGLEFGLRLSEYLESLNLYRMLSTLTIGNSKCDTYLKNLYALKYDKAIRISNEEYDLRFSPNLTADIISNYIKENPQDIVIMGNQSPEGNNFSTPQIVAHKLDLPIICDVIELNIEKDEIVKVKRVRNNCIVEEYVKTPAIFTIGNAIISRLRIPTLKDRMKFGKKDIIKIDINSLLSTKENNDKKLLKLSYVNRERMGKTIEDNSKSMAQSLYKDYLKERLKNI